MKININDKEVDLVVNGEVQTEVVKKAKLIDKNILADEVVRKAKEKLQSEGQL